MFWYGNATPTVHPLETICVRYFAVSSDEVYQSIKTLLNPVTVKQIEELREGIRLFVEKHRCIDVEIRRQWIRATKDNAVDWKATTNYCFKFIKDPEKAFIFAACNAMHKECKRLWEEFDEDTREKFRCHKNGMVHFAVRRILRGRPYAMRKPFQAIACGWPLAVLSSLETDNEAFFYTNWIFIFAVNSKNYHMFELLLTPQLLGLYEFSWSWFSKAIEKTKEIPLRWQRKALMILQIYIFAAKKPGLNNTELEEIESAIVGVRDALSVLRESE